jgi:hypothetical protein
VCDKTPCLFCLLIPNEDKDCLIKVLFLGAFFLNFKIYGFTLVKVVWKLELFTLAGDFSHTSNSGGGGGGLDARMVFHWLVFSNQPKWFLMLELFHTGLF